MNKEIKEQGQLNALMKQYTENSINKQDYALLMAHFKKNSNDETVFLAMDEVWKEPVPQQLYLQDELDSCYNKLIASPEFKHNQSKVRPFMTMSRLPQLAVAAAILMVMGTGIWFFVQRSAFQTNDRLSTLQQNDADPGKNSATLTLGNGKKIALASQPEGALLEEGGTTISKTASGQISYQVSGSKIPAGNVINTLTTARGQQYRVNLPDGTRVWLNASSVLKYPASFKIRQERRVELIGEAYFEVSKDKAHPFIVKTPKQELRVLGTHFNLSSYPDENVTVTTLLEGSVHVKGLFTTARNNNTSILKPGQQSVLGNSFTLREVDTEEAIAWTKGMFMFNDEKLGNILLKVSRWYNVNIVYEDDSLKNLSFWGTITRHHKLSKVLHLLERTQVVVFEIKGDTIRVSRK